MTESSGTRNWTTIGAVWAFAAVVCGTFGAHGLDSVAPDEEALAWWATGVDYHLAHALALVLTGVAAERRPRVAVAGWFFLVGSAIFAGTLYAMALGGPRWLGAVTPLGGIGMLAGWLVLALRARRA